METTQNHYEVLNVTLLATTHEIKQAYRSLVLKFHPDRNHDPHAGEKFNSIVEAYNVLTDPSRRKDYDRSREIDELINVFSPSKMEEEINSWINVGKDILQEGIKSNNIFGNYENNGSTIHDEIICSKNMKSLCKDPPVEKDLYLSLEEIDTGAIKKLQITRKIINSDGTYRQEEKVLVINVMPGWKAGTRVTFAEEGDRRPGVIPADVIFIIKDKIHKDFSRDADNNLIHLYRLSLKDALLSKTIYVPTLNGTTLGISQEEVIRPGLTQVIIGKGLPLSNNPTRRANLIIKYEIIFPRDLSSEQKQVLCNSLPGV